MLKLFVLFFFWIEKYSLKYFPFIYLKLDFKHSGWAGFSFQVGQRPKKIIENKIIFFFCVSVLLYFISIYTKQKNIY